MHCTYLTKQVLNSRHKTNGSFLTKRMSKVNLKFFDFSNRKEYLVPSDVVEYSKTKMTKLMFDLIIGCSIVKELGIILDFLTKEKN